jgi:hypothetical protein
MDTDRRREDWMYGEICENSIINWNQDTGY